MHPEIQNLKRLAETLRESDKHELLHSSGETPLEALVDSAEGCDECDLVAFEGRPLFICGVSEEGIIWMLASEEVANHRKKLWTFCKGKVESWKKRYAILWNLIDSENEKSARFLKRLGFTILDPKPLGVSGYPLRPFYWRKS